MYSNWIYNIMMYIMVMVNTIRSYRYPMRYKIGFMSEDVFILWGNSEVTSLPSTLSLDETVGVRTIGKFNIPNIGSGEVAEIITKYGTHNLRPDGCLLIIHKYLAGGHTPQELNRLVFRHLVECTPRLKEGIVVKIPA